MMQRDYYAFRKSELSDCLDALEKAYDDVEKAKQEKDKNARKQAEDQMKQAAEKAVKIEPHLAYLWYWARREEAERQKEKKKAKQFTEIATAIRDAWQERLTADAILQTFHFIPDSSSITHLPSLSFLLHITFRLQKPYLSKDERDFYLLDNPLRREKVFQTPMVAATSWKGALRAAMVQQLAQWWNSLEPSEKEMRNHRKRFVSRRITIARFFGTEKSVQVDDQQFESYLDKLGGEHQARWYRRYVRRYIAANGFFAGRLYFFPTFFNNLDLEVINPHDRKTGVGARGPILMECEPQGITGELVLLYVPFGPIGQSEDEKRAQVAQDLEVLAEGLHAMLTVYGFGAKTSSGYGVAEEAVEEGRIWTNIPEAGQPISPPEEPVMPKDLREFLEQHPNEDFSLKPNEWRKRHGATNAQRTHYKEARQLYRQYQQELDAHQKALAQWNAQAASPAQTFLGGKFDSLTQLMDETAKTLAEKLTTGGAA